MEDHIMISIVIVREAPFEMCCFHMGIAHIGLGPPPLSNGHRGALLKTLFSSVFDIAQTC